MGDIIEITTRARHPTPFYKVSSSAISFEVKAFNAGLVGLAKKPAMKCDYWFGFGGGKVWVKGPEGLKTVQGPNFQLSQNQFKRFWIAWDSGKLKVGEGFDRTSVVTYQINQPGPYEQDGLKYVTFTTHDPRHAATWKLELPPASLSSITKIPYKKVEGGQLEWRSVDSMLPDDAVIGGFLTECLYIIRAHHAGSLTPGHFMPSEGEAHVSWGGSSNVPDEFEVLCGYNYTWEATSEDKIPVTAFEAGHSEVNHETLYIGRVRHKGGVITGKVQPSHKVCYIPYQGKEVAFKDYEILTLPESNPYPAKGYFETNCNWRPMIVNENAFFMNQEEDNEEQESDYDSDDDDHREWQ